MYEKLSIRIGTVTTILMDLKQCRISYSPGSPLAHEGIHMLLPISVWTVDHRLPGVWCMIFDYLDVYDLARAQQVCISWIRQAKEAYNSIANEARD